MGHFLGYGLSNPEPVLNCTDTRVTLLGCGELYDDQAHIYRLPLPPSLRGIRVGRVLSVTLAWITPTNAKHRAYRKAALWFSAPENPIGTKRANADHRAVRRGTIQHEVYEGDGAITPFEDGESLLFTVNCRDDAGPIGPFAIPYAFLVTLARLWPFEVGQAA